MTAPRPAPLDMERAQAADETLRMLKLARAEIARLTDLLAQARIELQVAYEIIEMQRAALDAVRAALPLEENE